VSELPDAGAHTDGSYAVAYRLLAQLRTVARQLSAGLDSRTLADSLLATLASIVPYERAAVLVRSRGERLLQLSARGTSQPDRPWLPDLTSEGSFAEAWASQTPQVCAGTLTAAAPGSGLVVPLKIGVSTYGLVALETSALGAYPVAAVRAAEPVIAEAALRLGTALLFDEVREVATAEERRRLAREIHDGIAQELASFGYLLDGLAADARDGPLSDRVRELRREISRIISELRLSIFDLRSDVEQHGGLGAALSDYVRRVGAASPFRVHLSLDEGPLRLPPESEAELLRIAQEAITNARKHARAGNLWVDCVVDPPRARLVIEDDGRGLGQGRRDSYGLEIMRERAARLRADFTIADREPTGTRVEVVVRELARTDMVPAGRSTTQPARP
jgi:signal transduction histidine kinase